MTYSTKYEATWQRENRKRLKAEHKCYDCLSVDDYTKSGKTRCRKCSLKRAERARTKRNEITGT